MPSRHYAKKSYQKKAKKSGSWMNNIGTVAKIASTAMSVAKGVAAIVNAEDKRIDVADFGRNLVGTTNTILPLTNIAQGDSDTQRNGNSILAKSNFTRLRMSFNGAAGTFGFVRVIIFIDNMNLGAVPTQAEVLQQNDVGSPLNILSTSDQRFTILKDKLFKFNGQQENSTQVWKFYKELNHHIKYGGATSGFGDMRNGNLFVLYQTATNVETFTFWLNNRVRFYDN